MLSVILMIVRFCNVIFWRVLQRNVSIQSEDLSHTIYDQMTKSRLQAKYFRYGLNYILPRPHNALRQHQAKDEEISLLQVNLQNIAYCYELVHFCVSVCVTVAFVRSAKIKNVKEMFVYFDICHQMALLRKLYAVTLTYILDFK